MMNLPAALAKLQATFPWPQYFTVGLNGHATVARHIQALLPNGGTVLDVGCGPMDKTAVLSWLGYHCTGVDDLQDPWHQAGENIAKIKAFAAASGVHFIHDPAHALPVADASFDVVMACDVLEHLHSSPKPMLEAMVGKLKPGGHMLLTVPNAVNLRKRLAVLLGRSNLPDYTTFYQYPGDWRGHVREYVRADLHTMGSLLGLQPRICTGVDHMLGKLPPLVQPVYQGITSLLPGLKDTLLYVGQKPADWHPQPTPPLPEPAFLHTAP